jgi:molecular chaperone HscB
MSGTKRTYNLTEKNYFRFFGIEEKHNISVRSLTTHYKKIISILNETNTFVSREKMTFAKRAFDTLVDPISRAKYIIELHGEDTDVADNLSPETITMRQHYEYVLESCTDVEELDNFILDLKDQSAFIIDQIEQSLDNYNNYKSAMGLISKFYEVSLIHQLAKDKKEKILDGIKYVVFDR